jgi:hypothetical protein
VVAQGRAFCCRGRGFAQRADFGVEIGIKRSIIIVELAKLAFIRFGG